MSEFTEGAARAALLLGLTASPAAFGQAEAIYGIPPVEVPEPCDDLAALEPRAMMGRLTPPLDACLDGRLAEVTLSDADRRRIEELRIVDAWASGEKERWHGFASSFAEAHPEEADLAYKLALFELKRAEHAASLRWCEVALARQEAWTGETRLHRVYRLYATRAKAAAGVAAAEPGDEHLAAARRFSREWATYARDHGKDAGQAEALCAQLEEPCEQR
ncbi:MAG: hypothetical protein EP330_20280 [Deltaproteobacteria bacterium]|nr:MAG: hypothetical protein EP330_20280 [Deltaproteobacteria bacterium]